MSSNFFNTFDLEDSLYYPQTDNLHSSRFLSGHSGGHSSGGHSSGGHSTSHSPSHSSESSSHGHSTTHMRSSPAVHCAVEPHCGGEKNCRFGCSCVPCKVLIPLAICIPLLIILIPIAIYMACRIRRSRRLTSEKSFGLEIEKRGMQLSVHEQKPLDQSKPAVIASDFIEQGQLCQERPRYLSVQQIHIRPCPSQEISSLQTTSPVNGTTKLQLNFDVLRSGSAQYLSPNAAGGSNSSSNGSYLNVINSPATRRGSDEKLKSDHSFNNEEQYDNHNTAQ